MTSYDDVLATGSIADKLTEMVNVYNNAAYEYAEDFVPTTHVEELQVKLDKIKVDIDDELMQKYLSRRKDKKFPIVYGVDTSKNNCYCPNGNHKPITRIHIKKNPFNI